MRPGEVDGKDYYFESKDQFLKMIERDELLEYALVYGDYKGIPKKQIREYMGKGCDIVLRVDIQGAETLRRILRNSAEFVFLVVENELALVERADSRDELLVRIAMAREEVKNVRNFDYVVVNVEGKLENAVKLVESIIDAEKARFGRGMLLFDLFCCQEVVLCIFVFFRRIVFYLFIYFVFIQSFVL
ncbi:hypothetical protein Dsin_029497 [Dipteronia sinensis]|uniref:Guanylate kinase-like domain-containing protein n=1 Tax=Dipteronia sinensis TaxID=43782 RepID=A0AAD9ZU71_9ROSI|nr:hypothetical protein Dsin_029497 [Dipteronia sinensis]